MTSSSWDVWEKRKKLWKNLSLTTLTDEAVCEGGGLTPPPHSLLCRKKTKLKKMEAKTSFIKHTKKVFWLFSFLPLGYFLPRIKTKLKSCHFAIKSIGKKFAKHLKVRKTDLRWGLHPPPHTRAGVRIGDGNGVLEPIIPLFLKKL